MENRSADGKERNRILYLMHEIKFALLLHATKVYTSTVEGAQNLVARQAQRILSDIEVDQASGSLFGKHELATFLCNRPRFFVDMKKNRDGTGN